MKKKRRIVNTKIRGSISETAKKNAEISPTRTPFSPEVLRNKNKCTCPRITKKKFHRYF